MIQAQGFRYKKRIGVATTSMFLIATAIGFTGYLKLTGTATWNVAEGSAAVSGMVGQLFLAALVVLPVTFIMSWMLFSILSFRYMRHPGYLLEEGCYSDVSWLNLIDNQLVLLDKEGIVTSDFEEEEADAISETFQSDSSCENLCYVLSSQQIHRILFEDIQKLNSRSNEDFIEVVSSEETMNLQFKNSGTKAHAIKHIQARLAATMEVEVSEASNASTLKTVLPQLVVCSLFILGAVLTQHTALLFIVGLPAVFLLPSIVEGYFDRAVQTVLNATNTIVEDVIEIVDEPAIRRAA